MAKPVSLFAFVKDALLDDEVALLNHIRQVKEGLAGPATSDAGHQIGVIVVTLTPQYIFWRTATDLETSQASKRKLSVE